MAEMCGLVFLQIWAVCANNVIYVLPDNSLNTSCPSEPCATLSQYLLENNGTLPVVSNVEYHLLPGEHQVAPNIELCGLCNLTFYGITDKDSSPVVLISCFQSCIYITDSRYVVIRNIAFQQCDLIHAYVHETNLMLTEFWSCEIGNVTFLRYGLVANNLLGKSQLYNIVID